VRDIRVIWVTPDGLVPSTELRDAVKELLAFAATFERLQLFPEFSRTKEQSHPPREDAVSEEDLIVDDLLALAEDLAAWEGDYASATRWLEEAGRFSDQKAAAAAEKHQKTRYERLAMRARQTSHELNAAPAAYAARARGQRWRAASPRALALLSSAIRDGLTIEVPGDAEGVGSRSPGGEIEVVAMDVAFHDGYQTIAPWLCGVQVSALQPVEAVRRDETIVLTDLPIGLVDTATGRRHIRRFVLDVTETNYELSAASFLNLAPGTYRVEFVSPGYTPEHPAGFSSGPKPFASRSRWRRLLSRLHWPWK
jgi:hypothetical protein